MLFPQAVPCFPSTIDFATKLGVKLIKSLNFIDSCTNTFIFSTTDADAFYVHIIMMWFTRRNLPKMKNMLVTFSSSETFQENVINKVML